ncbi:hypothetical protein HY504_02130 [Candidatus Wolfebacteria bacterium]|nr:hypothetical protein [Candidatus Wolfebacteria bacterium]
MEIKLTNRNRVEFTGQAIAEVLIALGIGAIIIVAASGGIAFFLRQNYETRGTQVAASLAQEYFDQIKVLAESNWQIIYNPPAAKGPASQFYLAPLATSTSFGVAAGTTTTSRENQEFTRFFSIENINRDSCGVGNVTSNPPGSCSMQSGSGFTAEDPSTQKITVTVTWRDGRSVVAAEYISRSRNRSSLQTDWSGGPGVSGVAAIPVRNFATSTGIDYTTSTGSLVMIFTSPTGGSATGTIDSTYRYAWNDIIGWIDFYSTGNVMVGNSQLLGYATSSVGYIALDCATSPNGNICATSDFKVLNDGSGNLSGWAWNDIVGWISFSSASASSSISYQVGITPTTGEWIGWAWSDTVGWISFNCSNTATCGTSDYKVKTTWRSSPVSSDLSSAVFDTGIASGAVINAIFWYGNLPAGAAVKFQLASSNCSNGATNPPDCALGGWIFMGPDGTEGTQYATNGQGAPALLNPAHHNNKRYFRYKIFIETDPGQIVAPRVDDVIVNWSP